MLRHLLVASAFYALILSAARAAEKLPDDYKGYVLKDSASTGESPDQGKTSSDVEKDRGKPEYKDKSFLIYSVPLQPGFVTEIYIVVYELKQDKVSAVYRYKHNVGCMIVEPIPKRE